MDTTFFHQQQILEVPWTRKAGWGSKPPEFLVVGPAEHQSNLRNWFARVRSPS